MEALRLFIGPGGETPKISFHDLLQLRHRDLKRIEVLLAGEGNPDSRPLVRDKVFEFLFVLGQPLYKGSTQVNINPVAIC